MKNYEYYIGADVSKKTLDLYVLKGKEALFYFRTSNDEKGLKMFEKELKKHAIPSKKTLLCLENTGFYGHKLSCWAVQKSYAAWIENPISIKRSLGLVRGKNDKIDAYRIAIYAARFQDKCTLWQPPRKAIRMLQQLSTTRKRLINSLKRLKTPLKESALIWSKGEQKEIELCCCSALQGLKKSIKEVEERIDHLIKKDTKLSEMTEIITSIEGIGTRTAIAFIVATNEFKTMHKARKISCYAGVAPFEHTSGTSVRGKTRVSHLANKSLKCLTHMAALSAIKNSKELGAYYQRKVEAGKPKMVAINTIRNKLISRMCACVTQNRMYEKIYTKNLHAS